MEIKDILRNRRIELGLTMKDLSDKVGVSEGTISRWESGEIANMKRDKIALLAKTLHISPLIIMGLDSSETQPAFRISSLEKKIIVSYRSADPGTQASVRKLLDVEESLHLIPVAARPDDGAAVEGQMEDAEMVVAHIKD